MKISAILVSVNLAALPLAAANAAEEAVSDKAAWIKQSLAAIDVRKPSSRKLSLPEPVSSPPRRAVKLRPFIPGRRLPSQKDIELAAMQARMDTSNPPSLIAQQPILGNTVQPLSGQISAYTMETPPPVKRMSATWGASGNKQAKVSQGTPSAVPGRVPTLPGQVAVSSSTPNVIPRIPEPPVMDTELASLAVTRSRSQTAPSQRVMKQGGALLVQAPALTPEQQSMLNELVELNKPGHSVSFQDVPGCHASPGPQFQPAAANPPAQFEQSISPPPMSTAGPAPFPLSLLPPSVLQDMVGGHSRNKTNAPPAYFGSWHQPVKVSSLPSSGFVTHQQMRVRSLPSQGYAPYVSTRRTQKGARSVAESTVQHSPSHQSRKKFVAPQTRVATAPTRVAVYPPYLGSRTSMF